MQCPVCKEPMIILELDQVEIDHCFSCGGIWLDEGELELLMEEAENREEVFNSLLIKETKKEDIYRCPICRKKMDKVQVAESGIIIDKCIDGDGLWFDEGELEDVIKHSTLDKENKILNLLKEMFKNKLNSNQPGGTE